MSVTQFVVQPTGVGWADYVFATSDPANMAQAVYFDTVAGIAGTNYPTGTKSAPVNNLTDLLAICTARKIKKVVLLNSATVLQFTLAVSGLDFYGEGVETATPTVDFNGQAINCTFTNLRITDTTGTNLVSESSFYDCQIQIIIAHPFGGSCSYYNCKFVAGITNPPGGYINCYDDCLFLGTLNNTTGHIYIYGSLEVVGSLTNTTGWIEVRGDCSIGLHYLQAGPPPGNLVVYGNMQTSGVVTITDGTFTVGGNLQVGTAFTITAGQAYIYGSLHIGSFLSNTLGNIYLFGEGTVDQWITNAGSINYGTLKIVNVGGYLDCALSALSETERIVSRGSFEVRRMVAGATAVIDVCGGVVTIAATCTGGVVNLYGDCTLTDLSGGAVTVNDYRVASVAASVSVATILARTARELCFKDQWCATPIAALAIPAVAADLTLADVVFPANFLPAGTTIHCVQMLFKWRKQVDSSALANAINGASKVWRVKKSTGAWGTDDIPAIMLADNQMATTASATEGGDMIVGSYDVKGEVDDTNGVTYNFRGDQTNRADAPVVDGASLTLYDVYTGLRVYYTL